MLQLFHRGHPNRCPQGALGGRHFIQSPQGALMQFRRVDEGHVKTVGGAQSEGAYDQQKDLMKKDRVE